MMNNTETLTNSRKLRACANRRVAYVSRSSQKAVQSLREMSCAKSCPPIGAASKVQRNLHTEMVDKIEMVDKMKSGKAG